MLATQQRHACLLGQSEILRSGCIVANPEVMGAGYEEQPRILPLRCAQRQDDSASGRRWIAVAVAGAEPSSPRAFSVLVYPSRV